MAALRNPYRGICGVMNGRGQDRLSMPSWKLLHAARVLASLHDRDAVVAYLVETLTDCFRADQGCAILTNEAGGLDFRAAFNVSAGSVSGSVPEVSRTIVDDVARTRVPVLIRDASSDSVLGRQSSVIRRGIRSVMCAPMIARVQLMGVIYVDNLSKGDGFTEGDLNVLTLLSAQAAAALYTARLLSRREDRPPMDGQTEKLAALSQMAAGITHDFSTVLTAIQWRLELLGMRDSLEAVNHEVDCALEAVNLGRELLGRMSEFAEVGFPGPPALVDFTQTVLAVTELLAPRLQQSIYRLELDLSDKIFVRGQEAQLHQIAVNLMANALDAMPDGGTLCVSLKPVARNCVLCVRDTGHGIPEELKERLFEPFFSTKGGKHRGLGLSLVQALVDRHGGSIAVESQAGQGSIFRVYLPLA